MPEFLRAFCIISSALFLTVLTASAQYATHDGRKNKLQKLTNNSVGKSQFSYVIVNDRQSSFGYDILDNNRKIIHQPTVPGISGNSGFTTKEDAVNVAKLVIKKLQNNITLPAVSRQELDSLHIKL